jgi:hypothetical protein
MNINEFEGLINSFCLKDIEVEAEKKIPWHEQSIVLKERSIRIDSYMELYLEKISFECDLDLNLYFNFKNTNYYIYRAINHIQNEEFDDALGSLDTHKTILKNLNINIDEKTAVENSLRAIIHLKRNEQESDDYVYEIFKDCLKNSPVQHFKVSLEKHLKSFYSERMTSIFSKLKGTDNEKLKMKMIVLYHNTNNNCIFISPKHSLVQYADKIPSFSTTLVSDHLYCGFVNKISKSGLIIQFLDLDKSVIKVNTSENNENLNNNNNKTTSEDSSNNKHLLKYLSHLTPGQTVLARHKLDTKSTNKSGI